MDTPAPSTLTWSRLRIIVGLVAWLWVIEVGNTFLGHALSQFGIYPRSLEGLAGVMIWPFLHGGIGHLAFNTPPLLILGWFVLLEGRTRFFAVTLGITLGAGILVWLFARSGYHVGASGLVFGYFGYLVGAGIYHRTIRAAVVGLVTMALYGGLIFGILPSAAWISWEAHLFGFLVGGLAAWLTRHDPA